MNRAETVIWLGASILIFFSCSTDELIEPLFKIREIESPELSYALLWADIDKKQNRVIELIEDHGFVWSTNPDNSIENPYSEVISKGKKKRGRGFAFSSFIKNLTGNTTYYAKAFIKMNSQIYYSNEISFYTRPGTWKQLNDFPGEGLVNATGFALDGKGYIIGTSSGYSNAQVWEYDPISDVWSRKKDTPFPTEGPTSFVIDNIGYVFCNWLWQYDQQTDHWSQINTSCTSYECKGCEGVSSFVLNGKAYIGAGGDNYNESFVEWNPKLNEWKILPWMYLYPRRSYASCFTLNEKAYIIGGDVGRNDKDISVIEYDFINLTSNFKGSFNPIRGFGLERKEMVFFVVKGKAYVGMGYGEIPTGFGHDVRSQVDFYQYVPYSHEWIPQTYPVIIYNESKFSLPRVGGVSLVIGDRAFMGLGEIREYNRDTQSFEVTKYKDFWEFIPN